MDELESSDESFLRSHWEILLFAVIIIGIIAYTILTNLQPISNILRPAAS
jgi:hypothetical protein